MENEQPVLLCRRKMELPADWERRERNFNMWTTVGAVEWIETCETLERAWDIADERAKVLNTLADLFDADVAVSLYRRWEGDIK